MNLDTLSRDELFKEISDLAREQGVTNKEDWRALVDEVIESHLDLGELNKDQDLVGLKETLTESWEEYERESGQESAGAIDQDPDAPSA